MGNSIQTIFIVVGGVSLFLIALEVVAKRYRISPIITRRLAHVFAGSLAIVLYDAVPYATYVFSVLGFILLMVLSSVYTWFSSIHNVRRHTYGEIFLPLGILLTYIIASGDQEIFTASILILTLADPLCGIVSDLRSLQRSSKLGSLIFAVTTVFILAVVGDLTILEILIISAAATLTESLSGYGSDNLSVPLVVAVLLMA